MCAESEGRLRGKDVNLYMGAMGGYIEVGKDRYGQGSNVNNRTPAEEMIQILSKYEAKELATLIVELVRDSGEA